MARLEEAVVNLQKGEVVRAINERQEEARRKELELKELRNRYILTEAGVEPAGSDPCPDVVDPPALEGDARTDAMKAFGACLRKLIEPADLTTRAITYYRAFTVAADAKQLSQMSRDELKTFLDANQVEVVTTTNLPDDVKARLRSKFTDAELDEMVKLVRLRRQVLLDAEALFFAAVDHHRALVESFGEVDRYAVLLALRDNAGDAEGKATADAIKTIVEDSMGTPRDLNAFPTGMLHPYTLLAIYPGPGDELSGLNPGAENPFRLIQWVMGELEGPDAWVENVRSLYAMTRDNDNPEVPANPAPVADAVRVAFMDSGIDYVAQPDMGLFLGNGRDGRLAQNDASDADENSYVPMAGALAHGTGTSATLLTLMAHHAPELLRERKLDLAMWKVYTTRLLLSGPPFSDNGRWESRPVSYMDTIVQKIEGDGVKPHLVSVSLGFGTQGLLNRLGKPDLIKRSPWLWVMAAGNSGADVDRQRSSCFADVPAANRPAGRILCVGALKRGIVNDKIADYSNFGTKVDVYAYETYIDLCPNGTSCSTPAVASGAAMVKAKFPSLTPEQIKQVIVEAAEERKLPVDLDLSNPMIKMMIELGLIEAERTVKVFDPVTMMPQALAKARELAGSGGTVRPASTELGFAIRRDFNDELIDSVNSL